MFILAVTSGRIGVIVPSPCNVFGPLAVIVRSPPTPYLPHTYIDILSLSNSENVLISTFITITNTYDLYGIIQSKIIFDVCTLTPLIPLHRDTCESIENINT